MVKNPKRASTALRYWDKHKPLQSIEMGGLGKDYEQSIQAGVFEIIRACKSIHFKDTTEEYKRFTKITDKLLHKLDRKLGGPSNASWGVTLNLSWNYIIHGYAKSLTEVPEKRLIQIHKGWPKWEKDKYWIRKAKQ